MRSGIALPSGLVLYFAVSNSYRCVQQWWISRSIYGITKEDRLEAREKAKELRRVVEPIITLGKKPSLANRRLAFDRLRDRDMVVKVFDELGPRYAKRNGGYLRILKFGFRIGDNAPMALVELMDRPEVEEAPAQAAAA